MKNIFTSLIILLCLIFLSFFLVNDTFAQDSSKSTGIIEVNRVTNIKDRLWEKINLFFKFSQKDKINYQQELTEKRLTELKYVIDSGKGDMIEETSSRYSTYLGNLTETVMKNKMINKKQELINMLENHNKVLENLIQGMEANSGFWLLLKHDINYVKIYSDQIKSL